MITEKQLETALDHVKTLLLQQSNRIDVMNTHTEWTHFETLSSVIIGICPGDGIGESISIEASRILHHLLEEELKSGKVIIKTIEGLTIENRIEQMKAIPDDVLSELKSCHVILKGPTTTPQKGDGYPNIESANVAMRRELDLFANVRPVKVSELGIDWCFFRENTEGAYILGSKGIQVSEDIGLDFTVATQPGCERIIRLAFEFAKKNGKTRVTAVTKSNIIKTTDGMFSETAKKIAQEYPGITLDEWFIDIMTAKLLDPSRRAEFQVMVMPNLYGDILTDEAAQIQGGVGTAGSANIGKKWAMFEAIHGSAPRMVQEGRAPYADPSSIIKAAAMLLAHIGYLQKAEKLENALALVGPKKNITGEEFSRILINHLLL